VPFPYWIGILPKRNPPKRNLNLLIPLLLEALNVNHNLLIATIELPPPEEFVKRAFDDMALPAIMQFTGLCISSILVVRLLRSLVGGGD
jgi:hypothetical protein